MRTNETTLKTLAGMPCWPLLFQREAAALALGLLEEDFDAMVADGTLPLPVQIRGVTDVDGVPRWHREHLGIRQPMPREIREPGTVYFIQAGPAGPIKIGVTNEMPRRLKMLQNGNHEALSVIATVEANRRYEQLMHRRFYLHRLRGEWFRPAPDILAFVERLKG